MSARHKVFGKQILSKKALILIVALWTATMAFIVVRTFWFKYATTVRLSNYNVLYARYDAPAPQLLDVLVLIAASLVITFLISTPKDLVYGYVTSLLLSFFIGVVYVFLYIWYVQGYGVLFSTGPFDWEVPLFFSILNVFRIMFPVVAATCLIGATIGFFVRSLMPNRFR